MSVLDLHCKRLPFVHCCASSQMCMVAISDLQYPLALLHHFCVSTLSGQCQTCDVDVSYAQSTKQLLVPCCVSSVSGLCQDNVRTMSRQC